MAVPKPGTSTKHKRHSNLLVVGEKVEVRNDEEGFKGSWHVATVIACKNHMIGVQYENLLSDDGSNLLTEYVKVRSIADRELMRPLPPILEHVEEWCPQYGQCVDVYYNEAWWEGVVFDHEDGSNQRKVFFPDTDEVVMYGIELLRVTQDWDEISGEWRVRGNWVFLDCVEEFRSEWPGQVSVRQMWYDLQGKKGFLQLENWVSCKRDLWENLVLEVIYDNFKVTINEFLLKLDSPEEGLVQESQKVSELGLVQESQKVWELDMIDPPLALYEPSSSSSAAAAAAAVGFISNSQPQVDIINPPEEESLVQESQQVLALYEPSSAVVGVIAKSQPQPDMINPLEEEEIDWGFMEDGEFYLNTSSKRPCIGDMFTEETPASSNLCFNEVDFFSLCPITNEEDELVGIKSAVMMSTKLNPSTRRKSQNWVRAGRDLVPEVQFCPGAVAQYNLYGSKRPPNELMMMVRSHLAFLGWKIEFTRENGTPRLRYTSPEGGSSYFSLRKVCQDLKESVASIPRISQDLREPSEILPRISQNNKRVSPDGGSISCGSTSKRQKVVKKVVREALVMSSPPVADIEPEYCPQALMNYYSLTLEDENNHWSRKKDAKDLIYRVKKHLSAIGWKFWNKWKQGRWELRYTSPSGINYYSLRQACKGCIDDEGVFNCGASALRPEQTTSANGDAEQLAGDESSSGLIVEMKRDLVQQDALPENGAPESSSVLPLSKLGEVTVKDIRELQNKETSNELEAPKEDQHSANSVQEPPAIAGSGKPLCGGSGEAPAIASHKEDQNVRTPIMRKGQSSKKSSLKLRGDRDHDSPTSVLLSSIRGRHHNPRNILSCLIDNDVVVSGAKVHYRDRKNHQSMAKGQITRDGIKCSCCQNIFTLSKFEAHAGSTYHRPSANIFLEDGRSLAECKLQVKPEDNRRSFITEKHEHETMVVEEDDLANDIICSVCHFGGTLVLCDRCPSSFHTGCVGLKDVPEGDWFCPSCRCESCGQSGFEQDTKQFTENSVIICDQCEHQYHVGCVRKKGLIKLDSYPKGNWFCNKDCEQIFSSLHKHLGKPVPVGKDNVTWSLLKHMKRDSDHDGFDLDDAMENYSKLKDALEIMHECFEPVKELRTKGDLVEDVIFSRWSDLRRLNFRGFYTVILEMDDELVTAACIRVYGKKVAEIPLVGTRFEYRGLGMCHVLMKELEKMLRDMGIERLLLPAIPSVLNTWTSSFGFSKMPESERLRFVDYTFLEFQDTIMCQKLLTPTPSAEYSLSEGKQQKIYVDVKGSYDIGFDLNRASSEASQEGHSRETEVLDQGQGQYVSPLISCMSSDLKEKEDTRAQTVI